ncbi:DUF4271 domain-containing protein [Chitinophaga rhizophila]|uniref:DUF4271 domain-containing protein n=1 Tax=Chitinophaga rhizophila TaxID=2866212 RepID=A0ABS7GEM0_9BACT|nr:DUF4271 domain-containing protein [Chitinophaga rhizophila]MBW8685851.1 DUF4271 domain-containing protein [Chitinophaga rhizophila]
MAAQTDTSVRPAPAVQTTPARPQGAPGDTAAKPVKKKTPVIRRDSAGRVIQVPVVKPAAPATTPAPAAKPVTSSPVATSPAAGNTPPATAVTPAPTATTPAAGTTASAVITALPTDTTLQRRVVPLHQETTYDLYLKKLQATNIFLKNDKPTRPDVNILRAYEDLDWLVYVMAGVVLLLGIIRLSYLKYFSDLFRAFMNPTLSQRQLKDQLSQSPFPNFLLNSFFVISLALYLYLLMYRQQYIPGNTAWMAIPGLILLVALVYGVKYVMLRFCGWLFGSAELADAYIFVLYLINKVLGILLVPFLVILAFSTPALAKAFMYMSIAFIVLLVAYRYIRSYSVVKQYLSFSRLHFFLYLCAFEVAPVLIITKVLLVALTGGL